MPPPDGLEPFQAQQRYLLVEQRRNQSIDSHSNVIEIVFQVLCSRNDAELRSGLASFFERINAPDMLKARASLTRWMQTTLQQQFSDLEVSLEEVSPMLFDGKFKRYEDLLEYEAIERGRAKGREEGLQEGREEGLREGQRIALQDALRAAGAANGGKLPTEMVGKIAVADAAQLSAWIKSLVRGEDPRQMFARD